MSRRPSVLLAAFAALCLCRAAASADAPARAAGRAEGREQWLSDGRRAVAEAKRRNPRSGRARNVILFVGDGMGPSTVTAARILEGQLRGESGEENLLSFERLPYVALSKTYSVNQQTSDSAPTMTAIITGVKTNEGVISLDQRAVYGDHVSAEGAELPTLLELAERSGLSTGVVTTARVTHATPAACYAHSPDRDWESDADLPAAAKQAGFPDIARQLIEFPHGDGLEVMLGGGRRKFLPKTTADPEAAVTGDRLDGRNLVDEWLGQRPRSVYAWNKEQFDAVDARSTDRLLSLFEPSHMKYEHDRPKDKAGEPALAEMTAKAIEILRKNRKGYVLVVEAGRIDHAHHAGNAYRALTDTIALSDAVGRALAMVDRKETLVIATADHSHVFTMAGYPTRGNNILGKVVGNDPRGEPGSSPAKDKLGLPYTTLGYANGPGYAGAKGRPDLSDADTADPDYLQESAVPLESETHGGEDVAIYADGPGAHLLGGVLEQSVIFHVMADALGLAPR